MDEKLLRCPLCVAERDAQQGDYTRHGAVEIYNREKEDSAAGLFVRLSGDSISRAPATRNPSDRRNGIRVEFFCEAGHSFDLLISQHKGSTFLYIEAGGRKFAPLLVKQ